MKPIIKIGKQKLLSYRRRGLTIQMQADGQKPLMPSSILSAAADLSRYAETREVS